MSPRAVFRALITNPTINLGDSNLVPQEGEEYVLTIRDPAQAKAQSKGQVTAIGVSYDAFVDDIQVTTAY